MPEQPEGLTPRRSPSPLPRLSRCRWMCSAARCVSEIPMMCLRNGMFVGIVGHSRADGILGQQRTMQFVGGKVQGLDESLAVDGQSLVQAATPQPFGRKRPGCDGLAAAEGPKAGRFYGSVFQPDLQFQDLTQLRRSHQPGADPGVVCVERADVARM